MGFRTWQFYHYGRQFLGRYQGKQGDYFEVKFVDG